MTRTAAVIGLGLIGGSLAGRLRGQGYQVCGFDADARSGEIALDRQLIDERAGNLETALGHADLVVLAVPTMAIVELLPMVESVAAPGAIILDTGSVKGPIAAVMATLPGARRCIGGHPLSGSELSGPEAADPALFERSRFILCPSPATAPETVARAESMVRALGAAPVLLDAEEHDRILARTSHLPQVLSTLLALCLQPGDGRLGGSGLRDMTRLATSDPRMWRDVMLMNSANLAAEMHAFREHLDHLTHLVQSSDAPGIEQIVGRGGWAAMRAQAEAGS